jgi:hypothetical protein
LKCKLLNRIKKVNGCWEWQGKITNVGYGEITHERKYVLAHRCSYKTFKCEIPKGMHICHSCDNKKCINPDHLWVGNQKDNAIDMMKKNRGGCQKIKSDDVPIIRKLLEMGFSPHDIGEEYGLSHHQIYSIKYKEKWKHLE